MGKKHSPRRGSLAFYPRKRAKTEKPIISSYPPVKEVQALGFYGFKVGMTHIMGKSDQKKGVSFGQEIQIPVTIIEVPEMKVIGIRGYSLNYKKDIEAKTEVWHDKLDKQLEKTLTMPKKHNTTLEDLEKNKAVFEEMRLICQTNPEKTGFGKKRPEIVELGLGGGKEKIGEMLKYATEKLGKTLKIDEVFKVNEFVDIKAVTKGKGFQGVVKRFGVKTIPRKGKYTRVVGSISPWHPPLILWQVPRPGQMGYHTRTEFNKRILMVDDDVSKINPKGDFLHYGKVKSNYILLAGSIAGPAKRLIGMRKAIRKSDDNQYKISEITEINQNSKQ